VTEPYAPSGKVMEMARPTASDQHERDRSSGGETRTLNLAGSVEEHEYQHPLE
jgi:hypothetical protein